MKNERDDGFVENYSELVKTRNGHLIYHSVGRRSLLEDHEGSSQIESTGNAVRRIFLEIFSCSV